MHGEGREPHFQTVKNIKNCFLGNITDCEMTEPDCTHNLYLAEEEEKSASSVEALISRNNFNY